MSRRASIALAALLIAGLPGRTGAATPQPQLIVEPDAGTTPLVALINGARLSIEGEATLTGSAPVLGALEDAAMRGVAVRLTLERYPNGGNSPAPTYTYNRLAAHGVQVHWTARGGETIHNTFLIADRARVWLGSIDLSADAFIRSRGFAAIDDDPAVARDAEALFLADWNRQPRALIAGSVVLSPVNARQTIATLLARAQHTIDIYAEDLGDPRLENTLVQAGRGGVRVRILTTQVANAGPLAVGEGITIRRLATSLRGTTILVDGAVLFIGSQRLSAASLDRLRELGLILKAPVAIHAAQAVFDRDFRASARTAVVNPTATAATPAPGAHTATPAAQATGTGIPVPSTPTPGPAQPTAASGTGSGTLRARITLAPDPIHFGERATLTIDTAAGAACAIRVRYIGSDAQPDNLPDITLTADGSGVASESWTVDSHAHDGTVRAVCDLNNVSTTALAIFAIL